MKNEEFFKDVFAKASEAHPKDEKNREYGIVFDSCIECIRAGEFDVAYVKNQLGYKSDLPTTLPKGKDEQGKTEYFTRSELFGRIWNSAIAQVRLLVANTVANQVWGFAFLGMSGANGFITPYTTAIEKDSDDVTFLAPKEIASAMIKAGYKASKTSTTGQKSFTLPMSDFLKLMDKRFPAKDAEGKPILISAKHDEFKASYREKLGKYAAFRSERMSTPTVDLATKYAAW